MKKLEKIIINGDLLAIIIRSDFRKKGIEFFTPSDYSQQLAYMNRPKGYAVKAHLHQTVKREIKSAQETLFIKKGRLRVDFYCDDKKYAESRILNKGDVLFLIKGGHGFEFMKDTEIIEVKQGPFIKGAQSIKFEAIAKDKTKFKK